MDQLKSKYHLQAASLVETMLALVIIMAVFGVGILIYNNVVQSDGMAMKVRAIYTAEEITAITKKGNLSEEEFESNGIIFQKEVEKVGGTTNLWLLTITATTKEERQLFQSKEMILQPMNNEAI